MIRSTQKLIEYLKTEKDKRVYATIRSYVNSILKLGSRDDANLLLDVYLASPYDVDLSELLRLFFQFGDVSFAEKIFQHVIIKDSLDEDADPKLLELLGKLKYEPVKKVLVNYALSNTDFNYYLKKHSALGLLNFDCSEYLDAIRTSIESCLDRNLFPEFVPALVCKLPNKAELLEQLYNSGDSIASTDCNAGILLGFSLCGEEGKKYFMNALFNPNWETSSSSTGTVYYTYQGLNNLGITFRGLFEEIRNLKERQKISYALEVLFSLLDVRISDYESETIESFGDLYESLFRWENREFSDNLIDISQTVEMESRAHACGEKIEMKMTEEAILQNCAS